MADNKNKYMTPEEVQRAVSGGAYGAGAAPQPMQDPGYPGAGQQGQQMTAPMGTVPQYMKYADLQRTGKAATDYKALMGAMPGSYQGQYQPMLQQTVQDMMGQKDFKYDINVDPLYHQIKDNYIKQGRQAMRDTQGQAAAQAGGYGTTWGASAGQQAFQDSLGSLGELALQTYDRRFAEDQARKQAVLQRMSALQGLDDSEFGRYQYFHQDAQKQLADAYQKMKAASGGGSGKKKWTLDQYMGYVYGFYGSGDESYSGQSGGKGDAGVDAALAAGTIDKEQAAALKQGGQELLAWQNHLNIYNKVNND